MSELKHPTSDQPAAEATAGTDASTSTSTEWLDRLIAAKRTDTTAGREPYAAHLDKPLAAGEPTAREVLDRFDPRRANLPDLTPTDAVGYIETHAADRPWLAPVRGHDTAVQRLFATLDQGHGHALERHEGYPSDSLLQRRVQYLEDPAQLDLTKRLAGEDAFRAGKGHRCSDVATKIADPEAFATALARGLDNPDVHAALATPYVKGAAPEPVGIPISELLGTDGHRFCSGFALRPVGGSVEASTDCRLAWVDAYRAGRRPDAPAPVATPIRTFEGGTIEFVFGANSSRTAYEIITLYAEPKADKESS